MILALKEARGKREGFLLLAFSPMVGWQSFYDQTLFGICLYLEVKKKF